MRALRILAIACGLLGLRLSAAESLRRIPPDLTPGIAAAEKQFERGDYSGAEAMYLELLKVDPDNSSLLSSLGTVFLRENKYDLAEAAFKKALAVVSEDEYSQRALGIAFYEEGKWDEAAAALTKAIALNPEDATAHNYLGITSSQKGQQEKAEKELQTAIDLDPKYADANFNLAVVFATKDPPDKKNGRKYYDRALKLGADRDAALEELVGAGLGEDPTPNPSAPSFDGAGPSGVPPELLPLRQEAKEQFERGDYSAAEVTCGKVLKVVPNNLYTLSYLGVVLFREQQLNKVLAIDSGNATAHTYLSMTAKKKGWLEAAQKELETAIRLDPAFEGWQP